MYLQLCHCTILKRFALGYLLRLHSDSRARIRRFSACQGFQKRHYAMTALFTLCSVPNAVECQNSSYTSKAYFGLMGMKDTRNDCPNDTYENTNKKCHQPPPAVINPIRRISFLRYSTMICILGQGISFIGKAKSWLKALSNCRSTAPKNKQRGTKLPAFQTQQWEGYSIRIEPSDTLRILSFDLLPYFYGTNIRLSLLASRKNRNVDKNIKYKWMICSPDEQQIFKTGQGDFTIASTCKYLQSRKRYAIDIGYLSIPAQYKVKLQLIAGGNTSNHMTVAEFTLKDRDDFYTQIFWPTFTATLIALFFGLLGGFLGWLLRG